MIREIHRRVESILSHLPQDLMNKVDAKLREHLAL